VVGDHPLKAWRLRVAPAYYTLVFDGMDPGAKTERILADWGDGPVEIREVVEASPVGFERSFNVANARPHTEPLVWKGRVKVSGVQRVDRDLVIEPGTVIELESGAGVIVGGQLRAEGTAAAPIQFVPANPDGAPWGTIALRGPGAAGSVLRHCRMSGGSGLKEPTYEYSAMFSVHDVPGVRVAECQFSDSRIVDDMVHVVYGDVEFSNCVFLRALSDALDLDITHATIRECQFEQSGNDALDLMSTAAVVYDTSLSRNGDKGISVGEASQLIAVNVTISENEIGVQSKDGSAATLINASLAGNRVGVDAYKKNWRYQAGGQLFIYKSVFDGNGKAITADKKSQIVVEDSYLDADVDNPGKKVRIRIGASVDSNDAKSARFPSFERVSADKVEFPGMGQALERIDPRRRGAHTPER
jgi:hypothetical protein